MENEKNIEGGLKKPENLYIEETAPETSPEIVEANIEIQSDQLESKQQTFETNLADLGGEEGVQKVWSEVDEDKKKEILKNIESFSSDRKEAIGTQKEGLSFFNIGQNYDIAREDDHTSKTVAALGASMEFLAAPFLTAANGIIGTIDRIKSGIKLNKEKRKLSKLEKQYQ